MPTLRRSKNRNRAITSLTYQTLKTESFTVIYTLNYFVFKKHTRERKRKKERAREGEKEKSTPHFSVYANRKRSWNNVQVRLRSHLNQIASSLNEMVKAAFQRVPADRPEDRRNRVARFASMFLSPAEGTLFRSSRSIAHQHIIA